MKCDNSFLQRRVRAELIKEADGIREVYARHVKDLIATGGM